MPDASGHSRQQRLELQVNRYAYVERILDRA